MILIFDLDDTLYVELSYVLSGLEAVAQYGENKFELEKKKSLEIMKKELAQNGRGKIFDAWLNENKLLNTARVKECVRVYRNHDPKIQLTSDAINIIKTYKEQCPLYIVTDGHKIAQAKKVNALNIAQYFKKIIITHRYGIKNTKPSLYCFNVIRKAEKCEWEDIIYIGDNPRKDFVNLNAMGALTIRVLTGAYATLSVDERFDAKITVKNLSDIKEILKIR